LPLFKLAGGGCINHVVSSPELTGATFAAWLPVFLGVGGLN
jgi:hypothetical protein